MRFASSCIVEDEKGDRRLNRLASPWVSFVLKGLLQASELHKMSQADDFFPKPADAPKYFANEINVLRTVGRRSRREDPLVRVYLPSADNTANLT